MNNIALKSAGGIILLVISILNWFPPYIIPGEEVARPLAVVTAITTMFIGLCLVVPSIMEKK